MATPERREAVRVAVTSRIDVSSLDINVAMDLADLSRGGFAVRTPQALPLGQVMRFRFATPGGAWSTALTARAVYSQSGTPGPSDAPGYQTGFQFLNTESPAVQARVHQLVERATSGAGVP